MSTVPANPTQGKSVYEGGTPFYSHDDATDSKTAAGVYSHNALEFSATEAEMWCDFFRYCMTVLNGGAASAPVYNGTGGSLAAGTLVYLTGWNVANTAFTIAAADNSSLTKRARYVLKATLADATAGSAYKNGTVASLDTSGASAVGDPVYLDPATPGSWTLTAPNGRRQTVGYVSVKNASGTIVFNVDEPSEVCAWGGVQAGNPTYATPGMAHKNSATGKYYIYNGSTFDDLTGPQGAIGYQGVQGSQGILGAQGNQGNQGWQGTAGTIGVDGNQGPQGIAGTIGVDGVQGSQGWQGSSGGSGAQGYQGWQGLGEDGTQGPQGDSPGSQGVQGSQGAAGPQGDEGPQGDVGDVGPQGENPGAQGPQGEEGSQGNQGWQGGPVATGYQSDFYNGVSGFIAGAIYTLSDGATIAVDGHQGWNFLVTLGGDRNMGAPSNMTAGQGGVFIIKQDGTGTRLLTWDSAYKFQGGTEPTLSAAINSTDIVSYIAESASIIHCALSSKGSA